jgi:hypothetical protein
MHPMDTYLDRFLRHLAENKKEFENLNTLTELYKVPADTIESVVNTLKASDLIVTQKFIGSTEYIKITDKGYQFITTTSYTQTPLGEIPRIANITNRPAPPNSEGITKHYTMTAETGKFKTTGAEVTFAVARKKKKWNILPKLVKAWYWISTHKTLNFWALVIAIIALSPIICNHKKGEETKVPHQQQIPQQQPAKSASDTLHKTNLDSSKVDTSHR